MVRRHHEKGGTKVETEWLTPVEIIQACGDFDLDPCSLVDRPWDTAANHFTIFDDGLSKTWEGRVWLNPPYGSDRGIAQWLWRLANHGNGVALVFARTDTEWFQKTIWERADAVKFLYGRVTFYDGDGRKGKTNGGAPSVLVAYGAANANAIRDAEIPGMFIRLRYGA